MESLENFVKQAASWASQCSLGLIRLLDEERAEGCDGRHHDGHGAFDLLPEELPGIVLYALIVETSDSDNGANRHEDGEAKEDGQPDLCGQIEERVSENNDRDGNDCCTLVLE